MELFFKWIKQFYGTSENAVKTQIWIAVSVCVLVAIVKKRLDLDASLYTLLQILSVALFEKIPLHQALTLGETKSNNLASNIGKSPGGQARWAFWRTSSGNGMMAGASATCKRLPR